MAASPEDNTDGPLFLLVKVEGAAVPDTVQIQEMRVINELNRIPEAVIVIASDSLQSEDFEALDSDLFALGAEIEIACGYGDGTAQTIFNGLVISHSAGLSGATGLRLEVFCRDKALKLTDVRTSGPYEEMTDKDVMSAIITDAGLEADIEATTVDHQTQLRVGATDWGFLRLLADRNGFVLALQDGKIKAAKPDATTAAVLTATYGIDVMDLDISIDSSRTINSALYSAWDEASQDVVDGAKSYAPSIELGNTNFDDVAAVLSDREMTARTAREVTTADLKAMSDARMVRTELAAIRGTVKFQGNGQIWPLDVLEIANLGDRFSGSVLVTSVEQNLLAGAWTTTVGIGVPPDWTSDSYGMAAPSAEAIATPIHGLQIGKVTQLDEDPDGKQRIQVKLPMVGAEDTKVWARYAQPYASNEAGIQFLPEIDDEVIVAFLNADPNAPIVIGSLHNALATRPEEETADNNIKTIVTREKLKMSFDDENKIITVETPGGHTLVMDDDAATFSMEDMNGNKITMDDSGITIESEKDITVTAGANFTAEATSDATISGVNVTCDASAAFVGKGGANAELSSGGQTKVEGPMVMIN